MQSFCRHIVGQLSEIVRFCQLWKQVVWLAALIRGLGWMHEALADSGQGIKEEAERLVNSVQVSKYSHELLVDEERGIYEMDCSLFVTYVLSKVAPEVLKEVPIEPAVGRPRSGSFFQAMGNEGKGWKRIGNLMEACPGDVIAWKEKMYDYQSNSGHVMIVASYPRKLTEKLVEVEVFDATKIPHARDSRRLNGETGLGQGVLWFEINAEGEPVGYYWSERMKSPRYKEIVVGRVEAKNVKEI